MWGGVYRTYLSQLDSLSNVSVSDTLVSIMHACLYLHYTCTRRIRVSGGNPQF